jgi:major membrane immunogen (membrane-anchored lipoprotein)
MRTASGVVVLAMVAAALLAGCGKKDDAISQAA